MSISLPFGTAGLIEIAEWYDIGFDQGYTHLLVIRHKQKGHFDYDFPMFIGMDDSAKAWYDLLQEDPSIEVLDVYDLSMDFEDQVWEEKCRNF